MTLQDLLRKTCEFTDEEYGDSELLGKLRNGINRAYQQIAKKYFKPLITETKTLVNNSIDINTLSKTFNMAQIIEQNGKPVYGYVKGSKIICPNVEGNIELSYYYIPPALVNNTDVPEISEGAVNPDIYCYYAAYQYFIIEDDVKASYWLNLYNDGLSEIRQPVVPEQIIDSYGVMFFD